MHGDLRAEALKVFGASHKIGLAVDLHENSKLVALVHVGSDNAFIGCPFGLLFRLQDTLFPEKEIYRDAAINEGKPENIVDRIVEGKVEKYYEQVCLLEQPWIRDGDKTIEDLLKETIASLGENIQIARFARFALGESN
ncbi:hypothetical protein ACFL3H_04915 [Gemmatimonadota bacterium]